ncbi:hypothetical protein DMB38_31285 [Streptomyces sp. WAC 06738]|uniref:hypothetical protein n=1 Tax=Streptomyces sp. WAC 06738 TaxID=2203210 RepID=UPI000F6EB0B6|nr:hypothetical protein [Streptomyces sp. WAC 06738]AZM49663.1 hypothetical protein DMB38_31285 [Streptomyces sp. WAC 06738]
MRRGIVVVVAVILAGSPAVGGCGDGAGEVSCDPQAKPTREDGAAATVLTCRIDGTLVRSSIRLKNESSVTSRVSAQIRFVDPSGEVLDQDTVGLGLNPGEALNAGAFGTYGQAEDIRVRVASLSRSPR